MKKIFYPMLVFCFFGLVLQSCKKEAGSGGSSSIYGKVLVMDYNSTFTELLEQYYGQDLDVYLIYGDDKSYSDHTKTSYNGTYEFKYLRQGTYHVYVYSKDSTLQTNAMVPVVKEVSISENRQEVEVPEITIFQ